MNTLKTLKECSLSPKRNDGGDAVEQDLAGSKKFRRSGWVCDLAATAGRSSGGRFQGR